MRGRRACETNQGDALLPARVGVIHGYELLCGFVISDVAIGRSRTHMTQHK